MFVFHSFILYIRLFCYNYINNPKKRMGKWCFHFFFITLPTKRKELFDKQTYV